MKRHLILPLLLALLPAFANASNDATEKIYSRTEASVFTIEVHTGNRDTKSTLGSGYLVSSDGKIATNYHVVEPYLLEPHRNFIRVRNKLGEFAATIYNFDMINDLALLKVEGIRAKPLQIAKEDKVARGSAIVALGNPMGFNLSIIRGIFNGFSEKGLVGRMLLSMPLNSGMSGGPILDEHEMVIGTNVSIIWLSNSLSFGVPTAALRQLLQKPAINPKADFQSVTQQQFDLIEQHTTQSILDGFRQQTNHGKVLIGDASFIRPPKLFDCWDTSKSNDEHGIAHANYSCNLQFTPSLGGYHEVASVEIFIEYLQTKKNSFGFYNYLADHNANRFDVGSKSSADGEVKISSAKCSSERVRLGSITWKINTCVNAYVDFPELYDISMSAISLDQAQAAIFTTLQWHGFKLASFHEMAQLFLGNLKWTTQP